ncbi:UPF0056 inner membrane protein [Bacteroidia bacterium]|nr:UPF0056 inner membrane protein [Bacteroidia bacterium]
MTLHQLILGFVTAFLALFPVINPIGSGLIINNMIGHMPKEQHYRAICRITFNSLCIGLSSLLAGYFILQLFGLTVPVVQLGGGLMICRTAWGWLSDGGGEQDAQPEIEKSDYEKIRHRLFYPMSFPITVGAGTMAVIFTLMASGTVKDNLVLTLVNYGVIALAIIVMCIILYLALLPGHRIVKRLSPAGKLIINKIIAFLTLCIGLQIMARGVGHIFHLTIL